MRIPWDVFSLLDIASVCYSACMIDQATSCEAPSLLKATAIKTKTGLAQIKISLTRSQENITVEQIWNDIELTWNQWKKYSEKSYPEIQIGIKFRHVLLDSVMECDQVCLARAAICIKKLIQQKTFLLPHYSSWVLLQLWRYRPYLQHNTQV